MTQATHGLHRLDGKYRVLAQLGQGGTANVSLAVARGPSGFNKLVVLKSMKPALESEPEFSSMFLNEARLAARLNHPNIVQTNEVFESEGLPVIVMEYLEGQSLSDVFARSLASENQPFHLAMHLQVISAALGALEYAHNLTDFDGTALHVVHRDVSPQNVLITFEGSVKLLDFGIAKLSGSQVETAPGVLKGKLRYMSPEQITGEDLDHRADLFAIGVMLWEAVMRKKMWQGVSEPIIMDRILNGELPPATDADPELRRIITKAVAPELADRYQTAYEFQAELDDYLQRSGSNVRQRDIGHVVASLFQDVRARTQSVIESQLARVASLTADEYAEVEPIELARVGSRLAVDGVSAGNVTSSRGQRAWRASAILIGLLGIIVAVFFWNGTRARTTPVAHAKAPVEVQPDEVRLNVTAFPAMAKLYLDGQLLSSNPFAEDFARDDDQERRLVAQAVGFEPVTRIVKLDRDREIVLNLEPRVEPIEDATIEEKPKTTERTLVSRRRAVRRPSAAASEPTTERCKPPYYVDERGIKKFKPSCL